MELSQIAKAWTANNGKLLNKDEMQQLLAVLPGRTSAVIRAQAQYQIKRLVKFQALLIYFAIKNIILKHSSSEYSQILVINGIVVIRKLFLALFCVSL